MTTSLQHCPACGGALPPGRAEGLCPKCLIQQGLQTSPNSVAPTESSARGGLPAFVVATPAELAAHFPQLEILELLGAGGMGAVYKARQASLDRIVALKVLPREVGSDPAFAERFTREAKALARLNHPHIVTIHDIGQAGGLYYIVMEFVDGANLRQMINTQALTPQQALALVPQLCEALQYAHDEGIVHRDIKPENILVDKRGRAKVADFGLAKMLGEQLLQNSLTGTQQVMGTLRYMAPEQMLGARDVDHRADLYALGVVFYELLTGDLPLGRFPLPSEKAHCDARLDEVVLKALERERERRYQQAHEIKTDVESISGSYAAHALAKPLAAQATIKSLSEEEFEQAADDVRAPAWGLIVLCALQLLMVLFFAVFGYSMVKQDMPGSTMAPADRVAWMPGFFSLSLLLPVLFSLLILPAAIQMKRLRSYEFAIIGSLLAMLPLGPSCVLTLPLGLWSLLVLQRRHVRAAFRTPVRQRPEAWREMDAELLAQRGSDPAAAARALERVESRCRAAGVAMLGMSVFDLGAALLLAVVLGTRSHGLPPVIALLLMLGIPLLVIGSVMWGGVSAMRMRHWPLAVLGAVLCFAPLTPLFWVRWIVGLFALATLLRADVRRAFQWSSGNEPPDDPAPPAKPGGIKPDVYERSPAPASPEMSAQDDTLQSHEWTSLDERLLLVGIVGAGFLSLFPAAYLSGPAWDWASQLCGLVGGLLFLGAIVYHVARTAQRNHARHQLGDLVNAASIPWSQWWRERSSGFRQALTTLAMVGYLVCLALFLAYDWRATDNAELGLQPGSWRVTIGKPTPWLWIERHASATALQYTRRIALATWSVFYIAIAIGLMEVLAQTRRWEAGDKRAATKTRAVLTGFALIMGLALAAVVQMAA